MPPCAHAASASSLVSKARAAVERGDVDPARDLAPLVAALRTSRGGSLDTLIDGIEELGAYDGPSPASVKAYLQQEAPPALIEVARGKADWTIRGDALMALRSLNASDELLDRAAAVAAGDTTRSEEHTSELQSLRHLVCRLLLEKKKHIHSQQVALDLLRFLDPRPIELSVIRRNVRIITWRRRHDEHDVHEILIQAICCQYEHPI